MTIDIIALAKEAGFDAGNRLDGTSFILIGDDDGEHIITNELENFSSLLEAEIRKEFEAQSEEDAAVIDKLAKLLAQIAITLKGEELPLHRHGYHDLPELVSTLTAQNAKLMENIAKLQDALDKYGQHKKTCRSFIPLPTGWPHHYGCNCGLDELTFGNFDADLTPQPEKEGKE